jgi:hypothetical protein
MFSLYNFVAQKGVMPSSSAVRADGYAVRLLDGQTIGSAEEIWAESARQLGHGVSGNWDGYADYVAGALMPDDDEPAQVALVWEHADRLAQRELRAFCSAFDTLTTIGRAAYAQGTTVLLFFLGDAFPALDS